MIDQLTCPACGARVEKYRNPAPTCDIIIELKNPDGLSPIVLIKRLNPPHGWALPGGFIDYGESAEHAAVREALEETGLKVSLKALLGVYSRPDRDPRFHTLTSVFVAEAEGEPKAGDDAGQTVVCDPHEPPGPLCFDHGLILSHYMDWREGKRSAAPVQEPE